MTTSTLLDNGDDPLSLSAGDTRSRNDAPLFQSGQSFFHLSRIQVVGAHEEASFESLLAALTNCAHEKFELPFVSTLTDRVHDVDDTGAPGFTVICSLDNVSLRHLDLTGSHLPRCGDEH